MSLLTAAEFTEFERRVSASLAAIGIVVTDNWPGITSQPGAANAREFAHVYRTFFGPVEKEPIVMMVTAWADRVNADLVGEDSGEVYYLAAYPRTGSNLLRVASLAAAALAGETTEIGRLLG